MRTLLATAAILLIATTASAGTNCGALAITAGQLYDVRISQLPLEEALAELAANSPTKAAMLQDIYSTNLMIAAQPARRAVFIQKWTAACRNG